MKPIKPSEIKPIQNSKIPEQVIEVFNKFLVDKFDGKQAVLDMDTVAKAAAMFLEITTAELYDNKWMDVESIFEAEGWSVTFIKGPYYSETRPYYVFKAL